jgi:sentrin-specific protease 7
MLIIPPEVRSRVYIFNTYFMDKLCPYERVSMIPQNDTQRLAELFYKTYESVKKWVKEDLFLYQYLLFPLNLPEHWSLIVSRISS